ncbi:hypothetical protein QAD02_020581 [Eretmocerus hayati]|uniref:Uncharacterized protein n=1 Tax=Eretmocerus hayati TaxID=131215 RepID=A0ACC2PMW1_9HYME|nr:hypothetical protein QAD02_020581 [Eretmocerus hayati]
MNTRCANPPGQERQKIEKSLVAIPKALLEKYPAIHKYSKICLQCEIELQSSKNIEKCKFLGGNCDNARHFPGLAVLDRIKDKFQNSEDEQERIILLKLSPKFWSRNGITKEFGCTKRETRKARELMNEEGVLVTAGEKRGQVLPDGTVESVGDFYNRDDVSRLMPGMSDYVSVKTKDGKREHVQKRLLLRNLNELYAQYT